MNDCWQRLLRTLTRPAAFPLTLVSGSGAPLADAIARLVSDVSSPTSVTPRVGINTGRRLRLRGVRGSH